MSSFILNSLLFTYHLPIKKITPKLTCLYLYFFDL